MGTGEGRGELDWELDRGLGRREGQRELYLGLARGRELHRSEETR